jgi:hypothetical protein
MNALLNRRKRWTSSDVMKEDESIVESDLEAIRKAQAFGETAGADVSVKAPSKRQRQGEDSTVVHRRIRRLWNSVYSSC